MTDLIEATVLWSIKDYIHRQQDTIAVQVALHTIYYMFTGVELMTGSSRMMKRWDQNVVHEEE